MKTGITAFFQSMRPHHWVKNVVVFAAPFFAGVWDLAVLENVGWAFASFCLVSSGFYVLNDVRDRFDDRNHPVKKDRPIAAGRLSAGHAVLGGTAVLVTGLILAWSVNLQTLAVVGFYVGMQVAYTGGLKRVVIVDVLILGFGLVLRALGGATAAGVPASNWFILCLGLLGLFLGIQKRKAEMLSLGDSAGTRKVLLAYSHHLIQQIEFVSAAGALLTYALWAAEGIHSTWMLATFPFVLYAVFRYQHLTEAGHGEQPEKILLRDPGILTAVFCWAILIVIVLSFE